MILANDIKYVTFGFPAGEMHVRVESVGENPSVVFDFRKNEEIIELMLLFNAVKEMGHKINKLYINYMPFGRQDRVAVPGESFSLRVFADIVNSFECRKVYLRDPHSDVAVALIKNSYVISQYETFAIRFDCLSDFYLICPDGGALKKINKLAPLVDCIDVIECSKNRDVKTGNITGVKIWVEDLFGKKCVIVDDICDGGRTFIEIAKGLKQRNCGKIFLFVTHGLFTQGLEVFEGLIDEIYTSKGKIK